MKKIKITYWIVLALFSLMMLLDGISGIMQIEDGKKAFDQLGYPYYLMTIVGVSKLLGVAGLLQNKWKTLKEWAFAGFVFNFIGASASWFLSGGPIGFALIPWVMLLVLLVLYALWKKQAQPS